jgi:Cysteine-rich secretory protein family
MPTCIKSPIVARSRLRIVGLSIAALLVCALLLGSVFAGGAQAAVSYSAQETAFINSLNQYRAANGLQPLLVSDAITEACDRHNHDMAKYKFFSHYSVQSDWFEPNATPWDRMAASGYAYNTSKAENIAAGQGTAALVLAAWKASAGHKANMLNSAYKVIGVSFYQLAGSPYTYYWTTDFGGYVDPTAHAVGAPPSPITTRYQQNDSHLVYAGTWNTFSTTAASAGSYKRANAGSASVTVTFTGTYLAWIATAGTTLSKAYVSLDGGAAQSVDLARSAVAYQQKVWNTGTLTSGKHTVKIWRDPSDAAGKYISVDAFDVIGTLTGP